MRNLLFLSFLFFSVVAYSQRTTSRYLTLSCNIQQVGLSAGKPHINCNCIDLAGTYDALNVQVGDTLFFNDGGVGYKVPIDSIVTIGDPTVVVRVDWTGLDLAIIPTGRGSISAAAANGLSGTVAGMTPGDNQYLEEDFVSNIGAAGGGVVYGDSTTVFVTPSQLSDSLVAIISSGVTDGNKGDITVSLLGSAWTINENAVSWTKLSQAVRDSILENKIYGVYKDDVEAAINGVPLNGLYQVAWGSLSSPAGTLRRRLL